MNDEFKKCLDNKKILLFPTGKGLVEKEMTAARSDLDDASAGLFEHRYKWSTIQGYYAMFHAARALIYSKGYREKSHYCLKVALQALFIEPGLLGVQSGRDFLNAMNLREAADYDAEFSEEAAKAVIKAADKFIENALTVLNKK